MSDIRIVTVTLNPAVDRVLEAPQFAVGAHVAARRIAWNPAGKGINVSRVLAALGVRSVATGFVGRGELSMFEEHLERDCFGRAVMQLLVVRGRTRDNITIVDPVNDTETHLRDQGFAVQPEDVARIGSKASLLARPGVTMAFCGSLPAGLSPEAFLEMVERCRHLGARVAVDTSRAALERLRGHPLWLAKVNREELATLSGRPTATVDEVVRAAWSVCVDGGGVVENVVATMGADGAILCGANTVLRGWVSVHPGRIISTVGCGDALMAGMLSVLQGSDDWNAALREGLAAATANACRREAGFVNVDEVNEFRDAATVERRPPP